MAEFVKVKFPKAQGGWALLSFPDFHKPRADGTAWELYEEETPEPREAEQEVEDRPKRGRRKKGGE